VFLQEVQDRDDRRRPGRLQRPAAAQLDFLATSGYAHSAYGINSIYAHGHHGNAIPVALPDHQLHQPRHIRSRAGAPRHAARGGRAGRRAADPSDLSATWGWSR